MKKEYELILLSVLVKKTKEEKKRIDYLLNQKIDWVEIGGILMMHRLGGYFINGLSEEQYIHMPKELRKNLQVLVEGQRENQKHLNYYINELSENLEKTDIKYAGLKGIIFGTEIYHPGDRRSNDLDILVYEEDLQKLDAVMRDMGYIQSLFENGQLTEATKKQKLIQRMNYHDLIPYVKVEGKIIEIDINFLFDCKENLIDKDVFEMGTIIYKGDNYSFRGLNYNTNLAFLFTHFYREATGDIWVRSKRNFTMYKLVDIINYIRVYSNKIIITEFVQVLERLNLVEKSLFVLYITQMFFENGFVDDCVKEIENKYLFMSQKLNEKRDVYTEFFTDSFNLGKK